MLSISHISKSFASREVLRDVTFTVEKGSLTGLIGPSGDGKSTLFKIIGQILEADGGTVDCDGQSEFPVSLMFQEGALFDSLSVLDNVAFPLVQGNVPHTRLSRALKKSVVERSLDVLGKVGLGKAINKLPGQLSGGMRRRVSLARSLVARPSLLLLDDPTSGLDPVASNVIMNLIGEVHREYKPTVLIVSHDLRRLFPLVERVNALFDGKIIFEGKVDEISSHGCDILKRFVTARYDLDRRGCPAISAR